MDQQRDKLFEANRQLRGMLDAQQALKQSVNEGFDGVLKGVDGVRSEVEQQLAAQVRVAAAWGFGGLHAQHRLQAPSDLS